MMSNPFLSSTLGLSPGHGKIHVAFEPSRESQLKAASYQYPLKLVTTAPLRLTGAGNSVLVHTVYLLTYGGGLLAGDRINLQVELEPLTRLVLLTQGSTKLFKSYMGAEIARQYLTVDLHAESSLCYLPDPVQPFAESAFEQCQVYNLRTSYAPEREASSFCVLDWVSNGRPANGENWSFQTYKSLNEVFIISENGERTLLVRDNIVLDRSDDIRCVADRMSLLSVSGTLMLYGPMFSRLAQFVLNEFKSLPRIGGRKFEDHVDDANAALTSTERDFRRRKEEDGAVTWSVAVSRTVTILKFGARQLEDGKNWLASILREDGTVEAKFGNRALLCL